MNGAHHAEHVARLAAVGMNHSSMLACHQLRHPAPQRYQPLTMQCVLHRLSMPSLERLLEGAPGTGPGLLHCATAVPAAHSAFHASQPCWGEGEVAVLSFARLQRTPHAALLSSCCVSARHNGWRTAPTHLHARHLHTQSAGNGGRLAVGAVCAATLQGW